jgi:hypothetical protein
LPATFCSLERFDGACHIEVDDGVELLRQARLEVVALPLGLGKINDTDSPLKVRLRERVGYSAAPSKY